MTTVQERVSAYQQRDAAAAAVNGPTKPTASAGASAVRGGPTATKDTPMRMVALRPTPGRSLLMGGTSGAVSPAGHGSTASASTATTAAPSTATSLLRQMKEADTATKSPEQKELPMRKREVSTSANELCAETLPTWQSGGTRARSSPPSAATALVQDGERSNFVTATATAAAPSSPPRRALPLALPTPPPAVAMPPPPSGPPPVLGASDRKMPPPPTRPSPSLALPDRSPPPPPPAQVDQPRPPPLPVVTPPLVPQPAPASSASGASPVRKSFITPSNNRLAAVAFITNEVAPSLPARLRTRPSNPPVPHGGSPAPPPPRALRTSVTSPLPSPALSPLSAQATTFTNGGNVEVVNDYFSSTPPLLDEPEDDDDEDEAEAQAEADACVAKLGTTSLRASTLTHAQRMSLAMDRSARTRVLLAVRGEELVQKHPDYEITAFGEADTSGPLSPAAQKRDAWLDAYSAFQEQHAQSWKTTIGWIDPADTLGDAYREKLREKRAKVLFRTGGIPPSWRGGMWEVLAGSRRLRLDPDNRDYYPRLLEQLESHSTKSTRDIEKDVSRTMHGHALFAQTDGEGQAKLKRGLCAFSFRNPLIGYAQSMSTILATLLLHFHSEEHAFWLFDRLLCSVLPADYYTPSMLGIKTDCAVLKRLVRKRLPKLTTHLARHQFDLDIISLPWFMCLFVHVLPLPAAMRVWDSLFFKGSHMLLSVAIALLARHEEELCQLDSMGDVFTRLQSMGRNEYDCATLMQLAIGKHHVRAVDAARLRSDVRGELEKEYIRQINFK